MEDERDPTDVSRLLAGAAKTIAKARYCWLATSAGAIGPSMRPMGRLPRDSGDSEWTFRFITDNRSRKASDMRRTSKAALIFQSDADDAFVALTGAARLGEDESEVRRRWKDAYYQLLRSESDRAYVAFLEIEAQRLELWIRGVTPEPFGHADDYPRAGRWRRLPEAMATIRFLTGVSRGFRCRQGRSGIRPWDCASATGGEGGDYLVVSGTGSV